MPIESTSLSRRSVLRFAAGAAAANLMHQVVGAPPMVEKTARRTYGTIIILLSGGLSALDSFDFKPNAPKEIRGEFSPIQTKSGDATYSHQFPKLAETSDKYSLLRAMEATSAGAHSTAFQIWLNAGGTHLASALGGRTKGIPYVDAVAPGVDPFMMPERAELMPSESVMVRMNQNTCDYEVSIEAGVDPAVLSPRLALMRGMDKLRGLDSKNIRRYTEKQETAIRLVQGAVLELDNDNPKLRKVYGANPDGDILRLAGKLAGESDTGLVVVELGHLDHHREIWKNLEMQAPHLDQGVAALIGQYSDRVNIVMRGEFGRMPKINKQAGREHHRLHAGLVAGPAFVPGRVYGMTDKFGENIVDRPVTDKDFAELLLEAENAVLPGTLKGDVRELLRTG